MRTRVPALTTVLVFAALLAPPAGAEETSLNYSVREARAYAYKASLSNQAIELISRARPCDPDDDPYDCEPSKYNRKPNCPGDLRVGRKGSAPRPRPPAQAQQIEGGAGDHTGPDEAPPEGPPVRLNRLMTLAKLSHLTGIVEAGGMASSLYVDLSGRSEPEGHTQSEAFSNVPDYEERCRPENDQGNIDPNNHEHFLSRSGEAPNTYHLAQCVGRACRFGAGFNAERARTIVSLRENDGALVGNVRAVVEGLTFGDGSFTVDSLITFIAFRSDGTPQGLRWRAVTTASGAEIGGSPVALPPGGTARGPGFSVGVAEPYVRAPRNGRQITVVAPGLHFGSDEQSGYFGGAEIYASMGTGRGFDFPGSAPGGADVAGDRLFGDGGLGDFNGGATGPFDLGSDIGGVDVAAEEPVALGSAGEVRVFQVGTGIGIIPSMLLTAGLLWLLVMSRWLQRFEWGRRLSRIQPLKAVDWAYRAFVKT